MGSILLPFMSGLVLGGLIDLRTYSTRSNLTIFKSGEYDKIPVNKFEAKYFVLDGEVPHSFVNVPIDIALRVKAGTISMNRGPLKAFITSTTKQYYNAITIAAISIYRKVDNAIKKDAQPVAGWQTSRTRDMTHYVDRVSYGAAAVALYDFYAKSPADIKVVKDIVQSVFGTEGQLNSITKEKWEKVINAIHANKFLQFRVNADLRVFSTIGMENSHGSTFEMMKNISKLPLYVKDDGIQLYSYLKQLRDLDPSFPDVQEKPETVKIIKSMDKMMDDTRRTFKSIQAWENWLPHPLPNSDYANIDNVQKPAITIATNLRAISYKASIYTYMNATAFNKVLKFYNDSVNDQGASFYLSYKRLREDIYARCEDGFLKSVDGLLEVEESEIILNGTVVIKGLEQCKAKCYATTRCKSIGYMSATKHCWLYTRSTDTAEVDSSYEDSAVYDRKCH